MGYLAPLPENVAHEILRFVPYVLTEEAELLLIGNSPEALAAARRCATLAGREDRYPRATGLGVHDA